MMDFPGSVALAELLDEPLPKGAPNPQAAMLGERLLEDVRARLDALEPLALKPLTGRRAPHSLAPHEYLAVLTRHGFRKTAASTAVEADGPPASRQGADARVSPRRQLWPTLDELG